MGSSHDSGDGDTLLSAGEQRARCGGVARSEPGLLDRAGEGKGARRGQRRVRPGEWTAVMGPSGSGKSPLLHCAAGLEQVSGGQVLLGGRDITAASDDELTALRRREVGFVFQSFNLIGSLTAEQNVALPLKLAGEYLQRMSGRYWRASASMLAPQESQHGAGRPGVQCSRRLIGEQHRGAGHHGPRDRHPLLLPTGQFAGSVPHPGRTGSSVCPAASAWASPWPGSSWRRGARLGAGRWSRCETPGRPYA
jgi:hypothetical protein